VIATYKEYRNDLLLSEQYYYNNDNDNVAEDQDHRTVIDNVNVNEAYLQTANRDIALAMLQNCLDE
jgi:hypothetical protein